MKSYCEPLPVARLVLLNFDLICCFSLSLSLINGKGTSTDTQAKGVGPRDPFGGLSDTIALSSSVR